MAAVLLIRLQTVVLLCLIVILQLQAAPPHAIVSGILTSIVRKPGLPDALFPSVCPPSCSQLFHAEEAVLNDSLSDRCSCVCPSSAPVYLNTAGYCVDRLDECRHNLAFNSSIATEQLIPVVSLPARNGVLHPKVPIQWAGGGIPVSHMGTVECAVSAVFFDNMDHRWRAATRRTLFDIATAHERPVVMFRGSESDVAILTGSVVQLKLSCTGFAPDEHCLSFRVAGVSGSSPYLLPSTSSRAELLFILVLAFLLALSIAGSFVVWHLCWRIKKRQLISDIQMQFLFHLQQQHEAQKIAAPRAVAASNEMGPCEFKTLMERIPKRRLYFSAEYLDDAMMANPPPVAEQFLADLRRVIEVARERIRMRRFVPMLITIPEDHEENRYAVISETKPEKTEPSNQQESPKSDKSVDSGRESRSDSDDSSRDDEDDNNIETKQPWMEPSGPERISSVRSIVSGFESRVSAPAQLPPTSLPQPSAPQSSLPKPSRIPPRIPAKPRLPNSQIPTLLGQASPRPLQKSLALVRTPSLPKTSPPRVTTEQRIRKGYAVFPADPMLNKSLPRRKRAIPRPVHETTTTSS
uniref:Protein kinase domain-containing protein n=1 Tax=Haemonchus contortus TaxID=6289 RepID=A0A7I4YML8_HAECO